MTVFHITGYAEQTDTRNNHATFRVETSNPYPHNMELKILRPNTQSIDDFIADISLLNGIINFKAIVEDKEIITLPQFTVGIGIIIESNDAVIAAAIIGELGKI